MLLLEKERSKESKGKELAAGIKFGKVNHSLVDERDRAFAVLAVVSIGVRSFCGDSQAGFCGYLCVEANA